MIELRELKTGEMLRDIDNARKEMENRIWRYIKELGYEVYEQGAKELGWYHIMRNDRYIIHIDASFTSNFKKESLSMEIPAVHLDRVTISIYQNKT